MRLLALVPLLLLSGCKPDIVGNTYYCGPDGLCPPNLSCQLGDNEAFPFSCVTPLAARAFECPENTSDIEPDDAPEDGLQMGVLTCGGQIAQNNWGCIADGQDVDHYLLTRDSECVGSNPRFKASLRYPLGSAPLELLLINSGDEVVATSELCTTASDAGGTDVTCIEEADLPIGDYSLRVQIDEDANADCEGDCRFNRYQLFVSSPVS